MPVCGGKGHLETKVGLPLCLGRGARGPGRPQAAGSGTGVPARVSSGETVSDRESPVLGAAALRSAAREAVAWGGKRAGGGTETDRRRRPGGLGRRRRLRVGGCSSLPGAVGRSAVCGQCCGSRMQEVPVVWGLLSSTT